MEILRLGILGGLLGLDETAVGQFMLSRPLVAGALAGWMLGDASAGVAIGAMLELYLLVSFPTGGARSPEASTATVVAVGAAVPFADAGAFPIAIALGLVWGHVGGLSVSLHRVLNTRLMPTSDAVAAPGAMPHAVSAFHARAVIIDFVRGAAVTTAGVATGRIAVGALADAWPLDLSASRGLVLVGGAVSAGILLHDKGGVRRHPAWLVVGLVAGVMGVRFL
jgi:mannose/fructose/N-acetylgalactosamine-specific phosphotransferase system component IIC